MDIHYGTIIKSCADKNFFFVRDDDTGKDIFLHISGFADRMALPKGTRVYFRLAPNPRNPETLLATDVRPIPAPVVTVVSR